MIATPKLRWAAGLAVLLLYVAGLGYISSTQVDPGSSPLLPKTVKGLLYVAGSELLFFAVIFGLYFVLARPTRDDLLLRWKSGLNPIGWGVVYSVALRVLIAVTVIVAALALKLLGNPAGDISKMRPRTEMLIDFATLGNDPVYFLLTITLISFVLGGFREELWRAGVLAAFRHLFPDRLNNLKGQLIAVVSAACVFGLGHLSQGWGGVFVTGVLGLGLGYIMIRRQSIWEAALAHGFFDATTFAMLYLIVKYFPETLKLI